VSGKVVIILVVILLIAGGAGAWYYHRHHSSPTRPLVPTPQQVSTDAALAGRVGIQAADLDGWPTTPGSVGDAFAPTTIASPPAIQAQARASSSLAQCLHVPLADVTRAFGGPSTARTATSSTATYNDPTLTGTTASSVVDVMRGPVSEHADFGVFSNPTTFAGCYQPYAQAMLPYAPAAAGSPFTSVTITGATVPTPASSRVHVGAFVITRTSAAGPVVTTAVAVFGGRVQATLDMSTTTFPVTNQSTLVTAVEGRVAASMAK
jgi:hypothetical protein